MALVFQERADGYRVVRMSGQVEVMLASVETRRTDYTDPATKQVLAAARYVLLPRGEWRIHSAVGPLRVVDLEEIIDGLDKMLKG